MYKPNSLNIVLLDVQKQYSRDCEPLYCFYIYLHAKNDIIIVKTGNILNHHQFQGYTNTTTTNEKSHKILCNFGF